MTLAARLHMPLDRCKAETTYYDLIAWLEFFREQDEQELKYTSKQDYYLAQIAAEVRRTIAKQPSAVRVQDLLLQINSKEPEKKELTREERTRIAKSFWFHAIPEKDGVGYKRPKPQKHRG